MPSIQSGKNGLFPASLPLVKTSDPHDDFRALPTLDRQLVVELWH
jgi:hypothetical protein